METRLEISNGSSYNKRVLLKLSLFSYLSQSIDIEHVPIVNSLSLSPSSEVSEGGLPGSSWVLL